MSIIYVYRFLRGTGHLVEETGHYVWSHKLLAGGGDWGGVGVRVGGCWRIKGTNLPAGKKTSSVCIVSGGIYSSRCSHKEMTSVWNLKAVILLKAPMVRLCVESCGLLFLFLFLCSLLWVQAVPLQRDLALNPDFWHHWFFSTGRSTISKKKKEERKERKKEKKRKEKKENPAKGGGA